MARPSIFDDEKFEKLKELMRLKPTLKDAAAFFEVGTTTIERVIKTRTGLSYGVFRQERMVHTRMNLIGNALNKANSGDNTMMIFCLKNLCGWADNPIPEEDENMKYERPESMRDDEPDNKAAVTTDVVKENPK